MGYSSNHIAIAYYDGKALITLDVKGEIVSKEICSLKTATEELEAYNLADETAFSFCRKPLALFNKTYIAEVSYEPYKVVNGKKEMMRPIPLHGETQDKSLVFYDFDGNPFHSMNVAHDHAEKVLDSISGMLVSGDEDEEIDLANATKNDDPDLVRSGSYMRIPGKLQVVSIGSLAGFDYDESTNCISYRVAGVKTIFSERLSPEKVKKLIAFYNAFDEFLPPAAPDRQEPEEKSEDKKQQHESLLPGALAATYDPQVAEAEMNEVIFGQPEAIRESIDALCLSRMELREPNKPAASFLFLGPTGVGKTELVKQLAIREKMGFIQIDMGEFGESHEVARLKGSPPAYEGYEDETPLEKGLDNNKKSFVLFDEIEKAHPKVFRVFLSALEEGKITMGNGKVLDFTEAVIVFTSNITLEQANTMGFASALLPQPKTESEDPRLNENFRKAGFALELLNRVDHIVQFKKLEPKDILRVADKVIGETNKRLEAKGKKLSIEADPEAKAFLAEVGYNEKLGARPLKREFEKRVLVPIAREMARKDSKIADGGRAHVMHTKDGGPKGSLRIEYMAVADTDAPLSSLPSLPETAAPATKTAPAAKAAPV